MYIHVCSIISIDSYTSGNHTFASARGSETYEFLRNCFAPVWLELAQLIANPVVHVQGVDYNLDIVCGSDYKVQCTYIHMYMYMCMHVYANTTTT